jgi:hypothetical protein
MPSTKAPIKNFRFAEDLLANDEAPFYSVSRDDWMTIQTKFGRPSEPADSGLREWRPELYDQIVAFLNAQNPPAPASQATRKGSGVSAASPA